MSTTVAGVHHLVGTAEIAAMFDVSRQYVDRLTKQPDFPAPEVELASGRVWKRSAVEAWAKKKGRPVR